jgi:hypothetical protein
MQISAIRRRSAVKLSPAQAHRVELQIDGRAVPDPVALASQLQDAFGDHTFFVDSDGLNIVEPSPVGAEVGKVMQVGEWADDEHSKLRVHPPTPTETIVELGEPDDE